MEALRASYADESSDSDTDAGSPPPAPIPEPPSPPPPQLPPPPLSLLNPPNSLGAIDCLHNRQASRVRSFPHVEGNYAIHVHIPVFIPQTEKKTLAQFLKRISFHVPGLHVVDVDVALDVLLKDEQKFEHVVLGREFHISLGRTVPIRVHQIDSVVTMLRQKLFSQRRYWIDFSKWEVFVNDDGTRTFLAIEVVREGLAQITKQIEAVNLVYRLHNLPEFYKDPRPHISLVWASGNISDLLKKVVAEEFKKHADAAGWLQKRIFIVKFGGVECKIGNKTYKICRTPEE